MTGLIPAADPLGFAAPVWILFAFKVFGFFLHLLFMNLWVAGLPTALFLLRRKPAIAERLFRGLPFFMAFGINAGIVPLLFLQVLYPQFFYPATILQAWFWFAVIPLLLIAYYAVYMASFDKYRLATALIATVLIYLIGLMFSSAMTLTANPQDWPKIFLSSNQGGAVHGLYLYFKPEVLLRFLLVVGMAFGTLAAYFVALGEWFAKSADDKDALRNLAPLYLLGAAIYGGAGAVYAPSIMDHIPRLWFGVAGVSLIAGVLLSVANWKKPRRFTAVALIVAQLLVLASNAITRQWVQMSELLKWYDPNKTPVRGEWASFALFVITLLIAVGAVSWITKVALRRTRTPAAL